MRFIKKVFMLVFCFASAYSLHGHCAASEAASPSEEVGQALPRVLALGSRVSAFSTPSASKSHCPPLRSPREPRAGNLRHASSFKSPLVPPLMPFSSMEDCSCTSAPTQTLGSSATIGCSSTTMGSSSPELSSDLVGVVVEDPEEVYHRNRVDGQYLCCVPPGIQPTCSPEEIALADQFMREKITGKREDLVVFAAKFNTEKPAAQRAFLFTLDYLIAQYFMNALKRGEEKTVKNISWQIFQYLRPKATSSSEFLASLPLPSEGRDVIKIWATLVGHCSAGLSNISRVADMNDRHMFSILNSLPARPEIARILRRYFPNRKSSEYYLWALVSSLGKNGHRIAGNFTEINRNLKIFRKALVAYRADLPAAVDTDTSASGIAAPATAAGAGS